MLTRLSIRNIVLIEALDLEFTAGLCVLTGETGAGKSILLDSLSLVLGGRGAAGLVRSGARQASITASFDLALDHPLSRDLEDQGVEFETPLILRRTISHDGRSRGFINDQPCSVSLLRQVGEHLLEIHGQFEATRLFQTAVQRRMLDLFGGLTREAAAVRAAWQVLKEADAELETARAQTRRLSDQRDLLSAQVEELKALSPRRGEEAELGHRRAMLQNRAALLDAFAASLEALDGEQGADRRLGQASKALMRVMDRGPEELPQLMAGLERAEAELREVVTTLRAVAEELDSPDGDADSVEERLFALKDAARKHHVSADDLPAVLDDLVDKLSLIEDQGSHMAKLERTVLAARKAYTEAAQALSTGRAKAAMALERQITNELAPLKLDKAQFTVRLTALLEDKWGIDGTEEVSFLLSTNPGQEPAPLARVASGGELARLMLALKVVLADVSGAQTLVFDEVDSGIGGATADAVGDRLARLGRSVQVLVVTHSPQVAARGHRHWQVRKIVADSLPITDVRPLSADERQEEIARMLSGAEVTAEARAAAARLLSV